MSAQNPGGQPPDLSNLQDTFNEQQAKIDSLKQLVRQSEQGSNQDAQEKVKSIAQRLNVLKSKATKSRLERSAGDMETTMDPPDTPLDMSHSESYSGSRSRAETPGSEKIQLLRQQMELNRRKMAERESSKRDIEVMVSQLKARFDDTQQSLHRSAELGRSMGDLSSIGGGGHSSDRDRIRQLEAKVRILETELSESELQSPRMKELQTRILDLEETVREKDSLIQARTQAVTLMTESMSVKGRNTVDLLEDTQQEMVRMQENFVHEEMSLKDEIAELRQTLQEREGKIANLEEVVDILETTRYDLTVKNAELLNQLSDVNDYSSKLEESNALNQQLQRRIADLEAEQGPREEEEEEEDEDKGDSRTNEKGVQVNHELELEVSELKSQIEKLKSLTDSDLAARFSELEQSFQEQSARHADMEEKLTEKTVELSVLQASYNVLDERLQSSGPKSLFSSMAAGDEDATGAEDGGSSASQSEVLRLKAQLDEANKSQIKTKLKMKQMQKQMDSLRKASDQNRLILSLQDEVQQLQQQLTEADRSPVASDAVIVADDSDMGKKIQALEMTCHDQTAAINLLEEQKVDLVDDLSDTRAELETLRAHVNARESNTVKTELTSIELEEQLELHIQDKATLTLQVEDLNEIVSSLKEQARKWREEKLQLDGENQKLLEKLDKLSEKVSSAESIEILENLTQQERMEMESQSEKEAEATEDVERLQEESAEMKQKIDLFTTERKEVLDKMKRVQAENKELVGRIEELEHKECQLLAERDELRGRCVSLEESVVNVQTESKLLTEKVTMMERLESDSSTPGTPQKTPSVDMDTLRDSLKTLETEVDNYMKCKDKNGKLATSKKLAKQAKNCVTQFRDFVEREVSAPSGASSASSEEVDRLKAMLIESTNIKVERDQLEQELKSVRLALLEANNAQEDMRGQISVLLAKLSQKDALLEEHETDTAKLLADIKLLQETVQDNSSAEEIQALRKVLEKREEELSLSRQSLEDMSREMSQVSMDLAEKERRESALTIEKETMQELIEEQKRQLIEQLMDHEAELTEKVNEIAALEDKLNRVVADLEVARSNRGVEEEQEMNRLKEEIQFKQETIDTLNSQIMDLYKSMDGNATALLEREDEILQLNQVIEGNNAQLRVFEEKCTAFEDTIEEMETKLREVEEKHSKAANATDDVKIGLEQRIQELEAIVQELDGKNKEQLDKLKKFAANLKKKVAQCNELEEQLKRQGAAAATAEQGRDSDKDQLLEMRERQIADSQRKIQELEESVERLTEELNQREYELAETESTSKEWMRKCQEMTRELEVRHEQHQQSSQRDDSEFVEKIVQLEQALAETDQHYREKDESIKELTASKAELEEKIVALSGSLEVKVKEVEKCKILIKKRMKEIQELKQEKPPVAAEPVQNFVQEEVIQSLRSQLQEFESYRNQVQMYETKMQENALYIESLEAEKKEMDVKIQKLEEGIATIEERRNSMELKVHVLGATLEEKSSEYQEHEDVLVQRLSTLSAHDEVIMSQLAFIKQVNEDLLESVDEHIKQERALQAKITGLEAELQRIRSEVLGNLEQEVQQLTYQLSHEAQEKKRHSEDLERKLQEKEKEIEDLENEMSGQFVKFEEERRALQEQHEKLIEEGAGQSEELLQLRLNAADSEQVQKSLYEELERLRTQCDSLNQDDDEVKELRMQVVQDQTEIEHLRAQNLDLSQSHEQELDRLRCEIINLQENNQIDLLRADVEKFQRELVAREQEIVDLQQKTNEAWTAVEAKNDLIDRLGTKVHDINEKQLSDFNEFSESVNAMKAELAEKDHEIANLNGEISRNAQIIGQLQSQQMITPQVVEGEAVVDHQEVEELRRALSEKEAEIANYQQRTLQLQMAAGGASEINDPFAANPVRSTASLFAVPQEPQFNVEELTRGYEEKILAMEENFRATLQRSQVIEGDLSNLSERYAQSQQDLLERDNNLQSLSAKFQETQSMCLEKDAEVERLQRELEKQIHREQSERAVEEVMQVAHRQTLAAVPVQEEMIMTQINASFVQSQPVNASLSEVQLLREELERVQLQFTEKCLELEMAMTRIREFEVEREAKKEVKVVEKKQVAQVSPQQIPEHNIPAFSTAQFFHSPGAPTTASFFDQQATSGGAFDNITMASTAAFTAAGDVTDFDSRVPVVEEMIVPKTAYVCFPDGPAETVQPDSSSMTPNVDDSWGWNAEEAILEEQHQRMNYQAPPAPDRRIQALEDKVQELELERDRQRNEIHEFQLKSAKMLKKLKEYKAANESLSRQKSQLDANDMDQFIQDELREQVRVLEARRREDKERMDKECTEREALSTKIAQLTATNSKLTEMKAGHELEMERHLTEIRHLRSELQKMGDWEGDGDGGFGGQKKGGQQRPQQGSESSVQELEHKITDLAADNDELQAMLEDEKETSRKLEERLRRSNERESDSTGAAEKRIEELEKELGESMELIDKLSRDAQDIKVHLERLGGEHTEKIHENAKLQEQLQELAKRNEEFNHLVQGNVDSSAEVDELEQRIQNLAAELEYKNSDNQQMKEKIGSTVEALEIAEDNLKAKERIIENLRESVRELEDRLMRALEVQANNEPMNTTPDDGSSSADYQRLYEELKCEKASMEHELQVLNDQVLASLEMEDKMKATVLEFDLKQIEINELKATVDQLRLSKGESSAPPVTAQSSDQLAEVEQLRGQIEQLNQYWADAVEKRGNDVADSWKSHLEAVQQDYDARIGELEQQLDELLAKIGDLEAVKREVSGSSPSPVAILPTNEEQPLRKESLTSGGNQEEIAAMMKSALESQEMEIVTLKEQLAIRSAEFAALSARLDPYGHRATSNMASVQPKLGKPAVSGAAGSGVPTAALPGGSRKREQSELDLALYMLHQRDMRCEELTHELLILLEERDTLQLKWSDCMRQLEGSRRNEGGSASGESTENSSPEKVVALANEGAAMDILDSKLQSIHESTVSRGQALRKERDERLQQMAKLQQDIANIPQEAVSEIVGDYALAETNQSPSSVLMNWLWGKTGPKTDQ